MAAVFEFEPITVGRLDRPAGSSARWSSAAPIPPTAASAACICYRRPSRILDEIARYREQLHMEIAERIDSEAYEQLVNSLLLIKDNMMASPKIAMAGE